MTPMSVRPATVDDAQAIAGLHVRSWQAAYRGHMPDKLLDNLDPAVWTARWRRGLEHPRPAETTFVAMAGARIVGFATAVDAENGEGAVSAIYVDPPSWGTGAGRLLMDAAVAHLTGGARPRVVRLWALDGNERARRFYERYGFTIDGARGSHTVGGAFEVPTVRYTLQPG
ncbi:GNAT family N-acetyltransferase [Planosporangium thailandense]|uniref:GNAT family N-acetyltransferase n=1 Tax=Planosporangium thailandense TaxID=765197 RepID=A0ABX0XR11_9ACTN|nr:GNAT family N-acetyltransferase [Planosporangium thailandense]NJC68261.1 GNAT family N-acetyltransferase [Planosporangium thailandense]